MKFTIISPQRPFSGRVPVVPPILEYLGALALRHDPDIELELIDADVVDFDPTSCDADLVGITAMTVTVPWAYDMADRLREHGVPVVMGGIHVSALPDEAGAHADAVVVGEAESVIGELLDDAAAGRLKPRYIGERQPLDDIPLPLSGAVKGPYQFREVFTARGCPYHCTFCSVRRFFGDTIRYRPIDQVALEVEQCCGKLYSNGDDNIWGGDVDRSVALFGELAKGSPKSWYGFGDLRVVQGPSGDRLLRSAQASGLKSVWVGWESESDADLKAFKATGKQGKDRVDAVKRIQASGIDVVLFMVLGSRGDTRADFDAAVELADRLEVGVHPALLTPLPGTELYEEYEPYLLPNIGWDGFNGTRALYEHPTMTPREREEAYYVTSLELLSLRRILRHTFSIPACGFPRTHIVSLAMVLPMRRAIRIAYQEWLEGSA